MNCFKSILMVVCMSVTAVVWAETGGVIFARTTVGQIHELDVAQRTAIIGGFRYQFGSYISNDESKVKLLAYKGDATYEMLSPGMKVRIRYAEYGVSRYVVSIEELPPSTDIYSRDVIMAEQ